jgi:integrase
MNRLQQDFKNYLSIRRSLGFRLRLPGSLLRNFIAFLQAAGASHITTELALRWATQPTKVQPSTWAWRLSMVRRFATWLSATEPPTEISSASLLPHRYRRKAPHIYRDEEIEKLLRRTQRLPFSKGLRARTFTTLFGLLVATGMRVNEALGLDRPDVDLDCGTLFIRQTKFGKSRYVPLHPSTMDALKQYAGVRDRLFPAPLTPTFFISERGSRILDATARYTFAKVSQQVGLRPSAKGHGRGPRLHKRHTAATLAIAAGVSVKVISDQLGMQAYRLRWSAIPMCLNECQEKYGTPKRLATGYTWR